VFVDLRFVDRENRVDPNPDHVYFASSRKAARRRFITFSAAENCATNSGS
jgi:hypothetical protein